MNLGGREKREAGAALLDARAGALSDVTAVGVPAPGPGRWGKGRSRQLYLERARLIEMTERPLILATRTLPGEQTQIVRRPGKKASGRRWIFIFGGAAATATLLAAWLGFAHRTRIDQAAPLVAKGERTSGGAGSERPVTQAASPSRPIVAPLADRAWVDEALAPVAPRAVALGLASGRHSGKPAGRIVSSSRLAAHRPAHVSHAATTIAWVDPFVDR